MLSPTLVDLPELPIVKKKREQKITPKVLEWFRLNWTSNCAIEIKATDKNTIPKKALQDHQRRALLDAKRASIVHKIADARRRNPFDAFMLYQAEAFVVACFTSHGLCLVVPIEEWEGIAYDDEASFKILL